MVIVLMILIIVVGIIVFVKDTHKINEKYNILNVTFISGYLGSFPKIYEPFDNVRCLVTDDYFMF